MDIKDILTKIEYTKERSAKELCEFVEQKGIELSKWRGRTKTETYRELDKGLPKKCIFELTPFAYYAKTYYGNNSEARFKPCCGSEQYDGIIVDNSKEIFVEITTAIDGRKRGLQIELLIENGSTPWEHNIQGVKGNKTRRNRSASDILTGDEFIGDTELIFASKKVVKEKVNNKCKKSMEQTLPYGKDKTILIVTFNDTGINRNDFANFKQTEIDSMKHNFIKIILLEQSKVGSLYLKTYSSENRK